MGIPYYFYQLTKSYNNILLKKLPDDVNIYCLDFNGIIHPICAKLTKITVNEEDIIQKLWEKICNDINIINPQKIIICVDGVAPFAKMIQQRKRRYLSVLRNKIDNIDECWDTNSITPGTKFMKNLNTYFKKQIRYSTSPTKIIFSGSDEKGEGEHKIFSYLQKEKIDDIVVINGLDADLIILCLMSHRKNIYLMREKEDENLYVNIENLRIAIIEELKNKWSISNDINTSDIYSSYSNDIIESYCVMCSLLGNDFIPHPVTLTLKTDGLNKLISATGNVYVLHGLLVSNGEINYMALSEILQIISKNENRDIFEITEKYIKCNINSKINTCNSDYYGIKNKDAIASEIYENISNWKHTYYKHLFYTNISINSKLISMACQSYINGIYWTYVYYKKKNNFDNSWYYPYNYAPTLKDLANYTIGNEAPIFKKNDIDISPYIQLIIVLPKESKNLMENKYRNMIDDKNSGIYHLYPNSFKINTFAKTHLWECQPVLPNINLEYIMNNIC